jgi:hypothetical protein
VQHLLQRLHKANDAINFFFWSHLFFRSSKKKMFRNLHEFQLIWKFTKEQGSESEEQSLARIQTSLSSQPDKELLETLQVIQKTTDRVQRLVKSWLHVLRGEDAIECVRIATTAYRMSASTCSTGACCCFSYTRKQPLHCVVFTSVATESNDVKLSKPFVVSGMWLQAVRAVMVLCRRKEYIQLAQQSGDEGSVVELQNELFVFFNNAYAFLKLMIKTVHSYFFIMNWDMKLDASSAAVVVVWSLTSSCSELGRDRCVLIGASTPFVYLNCFNPLLQVQQRHQNATHPPSAT